MAQGVTFTPITPHSLQPSADAALDALAGDFVSSSAAPALKSACGPANAAPSVTGAEGHWNVLIPEKCHLFAPLLLRLADRWSRLGPGCSVRHPEGHCTSTTLCACGSHQRHRQGSRLDGCRRCWCFLGLRGGRS